MLIDNAIYNIYYNISNFIYLNGHKSKIKRYSNRSLYADSIGGTRFLLRCIKAELYHRIRRTEHSLIIVIIIETCCSEIAPYLVGKRLTVDLYEALDGVSIDECDYLTTQKTPKMLDLSLVVCRSQQDELASNH